MAIAPLRVNTSVARLYDVSERTFSCPAYWSNARRTSSRSGETERVSSTMGSSQSMNTAAGMNSALNASDPDPRSVRAHSARTARNPTNGIHRKIA